MKMVVFLYWPLNSLIKLGNLLLWKWWGNFLVVYEVVIIEIRKANLLVVILFTAHHTSKHLITLIFLLIKVYHLIDLPEEISFHDLLAFAKKTEEDKENNEKGKEEKKEQVRTLELGAGRLQFSQKVHNLICSLSSFEMVQRNISPAI